LFFFVRYVVGQYCQHWESHTLCQVLVCVSARATWQCVWLVGWF
jgi:hypothetical protein